MVTEFGWTNEIEDRLPSVPRMPLLAILAALAVLTVLFTWGALVRFRMRAIG